MCKLVSSSSKQWRAKGIKTCACYHEMTTICSDSLTACDLDTSNCPPVSVLISSPWLVIWEHHFSLDPAVNTGDRKSTDCSAERGGSAVRLRCTLSLNVHSGNGCRVGGYWSLTASWIPSHLQWVIGLSRAFHSVTSEKRDLSIDRLPAHAPF